MSRKSIKEEQEMIQTNFPGQAIEEHTDRSNDIQIEIENYLSLIAAAYGFNWTRPPHDIVRSIMNEIIEFQPLEEEEP